MKSLLFFGYILTIFNEGLIDILYIAYMNYRTLDFNTNGEIFSAFYSYYCIFMIIVVLPFIHIWIQFKK